MNGLELNDVKINALLPNRDDEDEYRFDWRGHIKQCAQPSTTEFEAYNHSSVPAFAHRQTDP